MVSAKQKRGYERELAQVYAPYKDAIDECEAGVGAQAAGRDAAKLTFYAVGRVWQKQPSADTMTWEQAKTYCAGLALAGSGWRLPAKEELKALYDSNTPSAPHKGWYWSSSVYASDSSSAWYVYFDNGYVNANGKGSTHRVRCVR